MNFENVDVSSLTSSINGCLNKISYSEEQTILNSINQNTVWDCSAKENLTTAISNMINNDYPKIKSVLQKLQTVATNIEEYKNTVQKIKEIDDKIKLLNANRYTTYIDSKGRSRRKLDSSVSSQINQLKSQKTTLNTKKNNLKNTINRLVGEI